jgi:hypothetical protein
MLGRDEDTARQQLRQRFLAGEQAAVERIVFSGSMGNYPNLRFATPLTEPGSTGLDLLDAIGLLEQWLAVAYGGVGVIHVPKPTGNLLQRLYQVGISGPRAGTVHGSGWVFGAGYPGTVPVDKAGDPIEPEPTDDLKLWLYATPPVTIRRSPVLDLGGYHGGTFDRHTNQALMVEERIYVADWPCGSAAVKVNTPRPLTIPAPNLLSYNEELWPA